MQNYYFTYGSEGHPFVGGWTKVVADDLQEAVDMFREIHPDEIEGLINCAGVYDEKSFYTTTMPFKGNMGKFQHEIIKSFEMSLDEKWEYLGELTSKEALHLLQMVCGYSNETANKALYALTGFNSFEDLMVDGLTSSGNVIIVKE